MDKVTEALTDNNRWAFIIIIIIIIDSSVLECFRGLFPLFRFRQISDLEVQMTQNSKNLKRLNADSQNLQDHVAALHT